MFRRKKDNNDEDFPFNSKQFRSVRFYTNINGEEKQYGYDYTRDEDGKEEYKEIGDPQSFDLQGEIRDRIMNFDKQFNDSSFTNPFEKIVQAFPNMNELFGMLQGSRDVPVLEHPKKETSGIEQSDVPYDIQIDENNKEMFVIVELPGFKKKDLQLTLNTKGLRIKGSNMKKDVDTLIPLNYNIDKEKVKATMKHGILEVKIQYKGKISDNGSEIPIN